MPSISKVFTSLHDHHLSPDTYTNDGQFHERTPHFVSSSKSWQSFPALRVIHYRTTWTDATVCPRPTYAVDMKKWCM